MEKKLEVKDLKISFRTVNGKLQAVRNISFDLYKGETLAIVGESGSGKSVTSRAIMGILANNAIVEGGEILYEGKDLMKIDEESFHKIRGDKVAMVFQDPMSSLNPIMRIGRQLTEAMLLKNRANRRESRQILNRMFGYIRRYTALSTEEGKQAEGEKAFAEKIRKFKRFEYRHIILERDYSDALSNAKNAVADIETLRFEISKNAVSDLKLQVREILRLAVHSKNHFVVRDDAEALDAAIAKVRAALPAARKKEYAALDAALAELSLPLSTAIAFDEPNLFGLGYYLTFEGKTIPACTVKELNAMTHQLLDEHFMLDFIAGAKNGIRCSADLAKKGQEAALEYLKAHRDCFDTQMENEHLIRQEMHAMKQMIDRAIDPLELNKDSTIYTFSSSLASAVSRYNSAVETNRREKIRFEKQNAKYEKLLAANKKPDWKVVPADYLDLKALKDAVLRIIDNMIAHLGAKQEAGTVRDDDARTVAWIDFMKEKAAGVVKRMSKSMAKNYAIKLMESVGIPEPRKRYRQYPFQFSGGMRQRIVIAIALTANPDILICDEPTTALDVTIQAQILELINKLKKERQLSIIFITHDLGVVANMADRIAVMYAGKIVEYGTAEDVFYAPAHPYTWALLSSVPDLETSERLEFIPGTPPNMIFPPKGDAFAPRNKYAMKIDFEEQPPMFKITDTHYAATWLLHPDAPKLKPMKIITDRIERMKKQEVSDDERRDDAEQNG